MGKMIYVFQLSLKVDILGRAPIYKNRKFTSKNTSSHPVHQLVTKTKSEKHVIQKFPANSIISFLKIYIDNNENFSDLLVKSTTSLIAITPSTYIFPLRKFGWLEEWAFLAFPSLMANTLSSNLYRGPTKEIGLSSPWWEGDFTFKSNSQSYMQCYEVEIQIDEIDRTYNP